MRSCFLRLFLAFFIVLGMTGTVSAQSLELEYFMNESSGPVLDYSGNNRDGTVFSPLSFDQPGISKASGDWGSGESINISDDGGYVEEGTDVVPTFEGTKEVTFSAWVYPYEDYSVTGDNGVIIGPAFDGSVVPFIIKGSADTSGDFAAGFYDGSWYRVDSNSTQRKSWYHVVGTFDSGIVTLYLNGSQVAQQDFSGTTTSILVSSDDTLRIGARGDQSLVSFRGRIDEPKIFNESLTSSEVNSLYKSNSITSLNTAPSIDSTSTTPQDWKLGTSVDVSANVSDSDGNITSVLFEAFDDGGTKLNETNKTFSSNQVNVSVENFFTPNSSENYTVYITAEDDDGATTVETIQQNVTDDTDPSISYNPSTTDSSTLSQDYIFVNVSASDNYNLTSVTEEFDGTNSSFNNNVSGNYFTNHTSLSDGTYSFRAHAFDDAGNNASTSSRTVTLDTTAPSITIFSPKNQTYNDTSVFLNVTASESIDTWKYSLDGGSNQTFTPNTTLTGLSSGKKTLNVYANDSVGNTGSSSVNFEIVSNTYVELNSSVQINQSDNNAYINVTKSFNVTNVTAYTNATNFGGINWSIDGNTSDRIDVNLTWFNDNNTVNTYLANYSVSTAAGNYITSQFMPRPVGSIYQISQDDSFLEQVESTANKIVSFTYRQASSAYTSFTVERTDNYRPEFNKTTFVYDNVNDQESLEFEIWSRGENDFSSETGTGTRTAFTNTSLEFDVSSPVDDTYTVTDFKGLTGSRDVNLSTSESGVKGDSTYSHTLDSQRRISELNITNSDDKSFDYVWNSSLGQDFTGTVSGNSKVQLNDTETSDFLNNDTFGFNVVPSEVTLGFNYTAYNQLQVNNTVAQSFDSVSTSGALPVVTRCSQTNNTQIDVSASATENFTLERKCNPGNKGNPTQSIVNSSSADERVWYNSTDMVIYTNKTSNTNIAIKADKSNLKNPDKRDANSLQAIVEGNKSSNTNELNVSDTGSNFRITVGDIQASTLYTDDSDWTVTYTLSGDNTTVIGGGGGGGTGPSTDDQTVYFGEQQTQNGLETFNVPFGQQVVRNLTVTNPSEEDLTAELTVGTNGVCEYIDVRPSLTSSQWSDSGAYSVEAASINSLGTVQETQVDTQIRFDLPNRTVLESQGVDEFRCEFSTASSYGVAEPLVAEVDSPFSLEGLLESLGLGQEFCIDGIPSASLNDDGSVSVSYSSVCLPLVVWILALILLLGGGVVVFRRI